MGYSKNQPKQHVQTDSETCHAIKLISKTRFKCVTDCPDCSISVCSPMSVSDSEVNHKSLFRKRGAGAEIGAMLELKPEGRMVEKKIS